MSAYSIYIMYFLALLYYARRHNLKVVADQDDVKYILLGLVLYCIGKLVTRVLIYLKLKSDYEIVNEHFLIVAIGVFLLYKLSNEDGQGKD